MNTSDDATTDRMQVCSSLHFVRVYVRRVIHVIVHKWSHRCRKCACSRTHFFVAICHSHLFVNFCIRRYCIYTLPSVTVDCCHVSCNRYMHDKICIQFSLRFIPQMNSCPLNTQVTPFNQWSLHLCGEFS